ncbi:hypothetical protein [Aliikangiella coralliicola]|uniref:Prolyl 4-hydroxylase alpha subunit Fe(2+) 2OG dioxygenase domain-containing protein n=1 Tax=Aliikangiella coralliicola TaxID=2592383 RepID=A0A545U673_9GAMM|nr:hypothetical protein [Aliikangiella coralliicola]TQV84975.1 hypothetical protein FLL46_21520 [Aliikangiella coralliicola]
MGNWIKNELCELNEENLNLLFDFKIPGIIVENFLSKEICEVVAERLKAESFAGYEHLKDIPVNHIGVCHNQWAHDPKSVYFEKIRAARKTVQDMYRGLDIDPVQMVIEAIEKKANRASGLFYEPKFGEYFAGAFRSFKGHGKLHADHAPSHIKQDWAVTEITRQLTWNIYYCVNEIDGELIIYDTIHTDENDKMKVPGDYYFPYEVLEREDHLKTSPKVGDLIIFNTQNFHEILGRKDQSRISQTSFMGLQKDGSLNLWS